MTEKFQSVQFPFDDSRPPLGVSLQVHSGCNARCIMCAHSSTAAKRPKGQMAMDLFRKIITEFRDYGELRIVSLSLQCEPLLDKYLYDKIDYIKSHCPQTRVAISTNAFTLNPAVLKRLDQAGLDTLNISVNAVKKETFKIIYGSPKFVEIIENIRYVIANKPPKMDVHITAMIIKQNLAEMLIHKPAIFDEAAKAGIPLVKGPISNHCGSLRNYAEQVVFKKHQSSIKKLFCYDLFESAYILFNGDVLGCCSDWRKKYVLGNVGRQKFIEIWQSERGIKRRTAMREGNYENLEPCKDCSQALNIINNRSKLSDRNLRIFFDTQQVQPKREE